MELLINVRECEGFTVIARSKRRLCNKYTNIRRKNERMVLEMLRRELERREQSERVCRGRHFVRHVIFLYPYLFK